MNNKSGEEEIIALNEQWARAVEAMDVDAILELYTDDAIVFDVPPPRRLAGRDAYREHWNDWFKNFEGPLKCDFRDTVITAGDDIAFMSTLTRVGEAKKPESGSWVRVTVGYIKTDGKWLATHEHISIPAGMGN